MVLLRGRHLIIYDLKDPYHPKFISNWGFPGQKPGAMEAGGQGLHHPVILGKRAYLSYLFGGDVAILDITRPHQPRMIAHMDFSPPFSGTHTTVPFLKMKVPDFTRGMGDIRDILVVSEESFASNCRELRRQVYIIDATTETNPIPIATFKVPDGDFCSRGGRFGPHQPAETRNGVHRRRPGSGEPPDTGACLIIGRRFCHLSIRGRSRAWRQIRNTY